MPAVHETVDTFAGSTSISTNMASSRTSSPTRPEGPVGGHRPLHLGQEERAGVDARMAPRRLSPLADHERADLGAGPLSEDRFPGHLLLLRAEERRARRASTRSIRRCSRRTRSSAFRCASARCWPACRAPRSRWMRCSIPSRWSTTFREELEKAGVIFCSMSEAIREYPELVKKYLGSVVPVTDNYYATLELGGLLRRLVRLHAEGRALPDGAVDLFPHQRAQHRPVRAHADHRREGRLRLLSRGLHGADARREPAPRRRGRAGRARRRRDQILDRPELVPGRCQGQGRHLQLRHQARRLPRRPLQDFVDAGRDRLGDHLEVSERASCAATIRPASSTRSPSRTATSRSTPAPR